MRFAFALGLATSAHAREQIGTEIAVLARSGPATARRIAEIIETEATAMSSGEILP